MHTHTQWENARLFHWTCLWFSLQHELFCPMKKKSWPVSHPDKSNKPLDSFCLNLLVIDLLTCFHWQPPLLLVIPLVNVCLGPVFAFCLCRFVVCAFCASGCDICWLFRNLLCVMWCMSSARVSGVRLSWSFVLCFWQSKSLVRFSYFLCCALGSLFPSPWDNRAEVGNLSKGPFFPQEK